jgi:hypothetical protein
VDADGNYLAMSYNPYDRFGVSLHGFHGQLSSHEICLSQLGKQISLQDAPPDVQRRCIREYLDVALFEEEDEDEDWDDEEVELDTDALLEEEELFDEEDFDPTEEQIYEEARRAFPSYEDDDDFEGLWGDDYSYEDEYEDYYD